MQRIISLFTISLYTVSCQCGSQLIGDPRLGLGLRTYVPHHMPSENPFEAQIEGNKSNVLK